MEVKTQAVRRLKGENPYHAIARLSFRDVSSDSAEGTADGAIGEARIVNERGEEVYFPGSGIKFNVNTYVYLDKGQYPCYITLTPIQAGEATEVKIGVLIK